MKLPRRQFLHLIAGAAALPTAWRFARAQGYPSRPVRYIVSAPPGGGQDMLARLMGQRLAEQLGQPFLIENRSGANIAVEMVVRAPPDGYTLVSVATPNAINPALYNKLSFDFIRDIAPVASFVRFPLVMAVNSSFPARTVPEFIAYVRANPGKVNMASSGTGTSTHVAGELFKMMAGVDMIHVPYRGGGPALIDLIAGQVQVYFAGAQETIEYVRAGSKVRVLAVTSRTRAEALPDIPTVAEFVPGFEASAWFGLGAPKSTPPEIVEKLNKEINAALADPRIK